MFKKALFGNTQKALALLAKSHLLDKAYLAGGTACALQLGHRISVDLDFFTQKEFDAKEVIRSLKELGKFRLEQQSRGTILGNFIGIKFSLFVYKYPVLFPYKFFSDAKNFCEGEINILDLKDIAAMKIDAISARGIKRDFIDLYFICKSGIALKDILFFYDRKYKTLSSNIIHIQKSLVYFVDAEASPMPKMTKEIEWDKVKLFFEEEVRRLNSQP